MKTRRSIRKYKPDMVPKELLRRLQRLEHTLQLAWASSLQSLLPLQTKELRDRLSKMNAQVMGSNSDPFYGAPVVLIVLANKKLWHLCLRWKPCHG